MALSVCAATMLTASAETKDTKDTKAVTKAHITKVDAKAGTIKRVAANPASGGYDRLMGSLERILNKS